MNRKPTKRERALDVIIGGLQYLYEGVRHDDSYGQGIGFGEMLTAYYHLLSDEDRYRMVGDPVAWAQWLREGLAEIERGGGAGRAPRTRSMLAAKLYYARDSIKFLFGDKYEERIQFYRTLVRAAAEHMQCSATAAILKIVEEERSGGYEFEGMNVFCLMAAAVDISEGA